ncbi:MAG: signal peptidase II [Bacteroidota bacterium]
MWRYLSISLVVVALDQWVKVSVKKSMYLGEEISLLGDFFSLYFAENNGFAFGLTLSELSEKLGFMLPAQHGKLILSIFSLLAIGGLFWVLKKFARHKSALPYFIALILGGALGNIIDRLFYGVIFSSINLYEGGLFHGQVVDMFIFNFGPSGFSSPIFNLADMAISFGIICILLFQKRFQKRHERLSMSSRAEGKPSSLPT